MSTFIEELTERSQKESKVRAVLKRSLAFYPGTYPPAFPYVEHRYKDENGRVAYYLVAGLWAMHWREGGSGVGQSIAKVCRMLYRDRDQSSSIEQRFIALLDADPGQLPYRLRQMVALLKDYDIDFSKLLTDIELWNHPKKYVQIHWAREFYNRASEENSKIETINKEKE